MNLLTLPEMSLPELLEEYRRGSIAFRQAYADIPDSLLHVKPPDGSWTLHQIAIHLVDSDIVGTVRMKRVACMEKPLLIGFDETTMAELPGSDKIPLGLALDLFEMNRQATSHILENIPVDTFSRVGVHNEAGMLSLRDLVEKFIKHLHHHLQFVDQKKLTLRQE